MEGDLVAEQIKDHLLKMMSFQLGGGQEEDGNKTLTLYVKTLLLLKTPRIDQTFHLS
jgi:hypothetical protein